MTTTTRVYRWDDASAPTIEGVVGSFSSAMRQLLVGTSGVAYGSGATEKPAAGWSVAFTGTNKVALRNSLAAGGSGCYLRIDDSGGGAGGAKEALIQVFESMTDVDTGTNPASSNNSNTGVWVRKSEAASAGARAWTIYADERTVYFNTFANSATLPTVAANTTASQYMTIGGAGDIEPILPGDPSCFVAARVTANSTAFSGSSIGNMRNFSASLTGADQGFALSRDYNLSPARTPANIAILASSTSSDNQGFGGQSAPMAEWLLGTASDTLMHPAWIGAQGGIRGRARGLFVPMNRIYGSFGMGDSIAPLGGIAGQSLKVLAGLSLGSSSTIYCSRLLVESALSWDDV